MHREICAHLKVNTLCTINGFDSRDADPRAAKANTAERFLHRGMMGSMSQVNWWIDIIDYKKESNPFTCYHSREEGNASFYCSLISQEASCKWVCNLVLITGKIG